MIKSLKRAAGKRFPGSSLPARPRARPTALLLAALALLLLLLSNLPLAAAAPTPQQPPPRTPTQPVPSRPNLAPPPGTPPGVRPPLRTNTPARPGTTAGKTNALPTAKTGSTNTLAAWTQAIKQFPKNQAFYPAIVGVVCVLLGLVLVIRFLKGKSHAAKPTEISPVAPAGAAKLRRKTAGKVHACNVLHVSAQSRQVWQFDTSNGRFSLNREQITMPGQELPGRLVRKDWRSLFQRKLNVAWLPPEQVFLRVAQFPKSDFDETLSMVELQLEKLSPMPINQIVWSLHLLPHKEENLQTVIVMIVARAAVEEFLGKLEGEGYLADRLELPVIDQLQATAVTEDGAWIYPETSGKNTALVAWWFGGVLQNLDLVTLPASNRASNLKEQMLQMAWAGEMEGWLTSSPNWHLVADPATAAEWEPPLREGLEQPVRVEEPLRPSELASRTAARAARADMRANLLPAEFATRYQAQFVDRLWMRGLAALLVLYMLGVAVYFVALGYVSYQTKTVENKVARLGSTYTNAMQLKAQSQVLKDRQELKFAALNCWATTAKLMPPAITLESMNFQDGRKLMLNGTAPADQVSALIDFEAAMRKASDPSGQPMFDVNKGDPLSYHVNPGAATVSWNFALELKRTEAQ